MSLRKALHQLIQRLPQLVFDFEVFLYWNMRCVVCIE